jgi:hypothetical protein
MPFRLPFGRKPKPGPATSDPLPVVPQRHAGPLRTAGRLLARGFSALDHGFAWLAVPFGVRLRNPILRYTVLLGLFGLIFVLGALRLDRVSLGALVFGYVGVLAIGRAWVLNEKKRIRIVKKLDDQDPDRLPDLRGSALVSALLLLILFPLLYQQVEEMFHLYKVNEEPKFWDWLRFAIDKTYLKALPDWSILYGVRIDSIDFQEKWGRHLVLLSRLTFDYILIQGLLRLLFIRATIREAVAVIKIDPDVAVRVGKRAIPSLLEKLQDPDKSVRGAAANVLTQLGDSTALQQIQEAHSK